MTNSASAIQQISIENLLVHQSNPRYEPQPTQRDALAKLLNEEKMKLANLAEDIAIRSLNPSELIMVTTSESDPAQYRVLEGNRRIAAIKLAADPALLGSLGASATLQRRFREINDQYKDELPRQANCLVISAEDAEYWINLKHTGENDGVGIVQWSGAQRARFRGSSPQLQVIDLVEKTNYIDEKTRKLLPKIRLTNIQRMLETPDAYRLLGLEVIGNEIQLLEPAELVLPRLAFLVTDIARRYVRVPYIDTKLQRVQYAQEIVGFVNAGVTSPEAREGVTPSTSGTSASASSAGTESTATKSATKQAAKSTRTHRPERLTLIPTQFRIAIPQPRINRIYHELQKLSIDQYVNSVAVLFRVFLELSVDEFSKKHKIKLKKPVVIKPGEPKRAPQDMKLKDKIRTVAQFMEDKQISDFNELRGLRVLLGNRDHILSIESLNAYVHNQHYNPTSNDLKTTWDNIYPFIGHLWTA